ncbi:hypothetical protein [Ferruginibacter sp. HRS2-29]|uniref:hypothetical protein n=1 Tax=Ferruginibacter sp. HRS2-29 TaxID=2487334 RepID=UPI0020CD3AF6|nr:hypothetical protein [Ferruginibacter sp. HRS2-29]MCP9751211.1 hypothetical protein [Ferruginibacter sp. HRS2-29]
MKKMNKVFLFAMIMAAAVACKKSKDEPASPTTRNQWDGRYRMEGTMTDLTNSDFRWKDNTYLYTLQTSGTNTDSLVSADLGFPGIVIANITNATFYSGFGLVLTLDAANNKVTGLTNYFGQPSSAGRSAVLDPTGANSIDPATKNIKLKFFMDQTGVTGHRATFDVTLVYLGARP